MYPGGSHYSRIETQVLHSGLFIAADPSCHAEKNFTPRLDKFLGYMGASNVALNKDAHRPTSIDSICGVSQ